MSISAMNDLKCTDEEWAKIIANQKEQRRLERKAYRARKAKRKLKENATKPIDMGNDPDGELDSWW